MRPVEVKKEEDVVQIPVQSVFLKLAELARAVIHLLTSAIHHSALCKIADFWLFMDQHEFSIVESISVMVDYIVDELLQMGGRLRIMRVRATTCLLCTTYARRPASVSSFCS